MSTTKKKTSRRKRESNRKNAQKSIGPKSPKGKEIASQNSIKHGLYSDQIIIRSTNFSEDPQEYHALASSLYDELKPAGSLQKHLVTKIANCIWRSDRVIRAETAHINEQMDEVDKAIEMEELNKKYRYPVHKRDSISLTDEERDRVLEVEIGKRSIPSDQSGRFILRCEMRLDRQLTRAYRMLRQLQREATERVRVGPNQPTPAVRPETRVVTKSSETKPNALQHDSTQLLTDDQSPLAARTQDSDFDDNNNPVGAKRDHPGLSSETKPNPPQTKPTQSLTDINERIANDPTMIPLEEFVMRERKGTLGMEEHEE